MEVVVVAALGRKVGASGINIFMDQQFCSNQLSPHFPALQSVDATTSYEPSLFEHFFISFILGGNSSKHSFTSVPCRESHGTDFSLVDRPLVGSRKKHMFAPLWDKNLIYHPIIDLGLQKTRSIIKSTNEYRGHR